MAILLFLFAVTVRAADDATARLPALLQPYATLVASCDRYNKTGERPGWVTRYRQDFDREPPEGPDWRALPAVGAAPALGLTNVAGQTALMVVAPAEAQALIAIGPAVGGACAVEMRAWSDTDKPCDLSLFLDGVGQGPGFQFGANYNVRNLLWLDRGDGPWNRTVPAPGQQRIVPRHWHRVRLEVRDQTLTGFVDEQVVGRQPLQRPIAAAHQWQPVVYIFSSRVFIDYFLVQVPGDMKPADSTAAWREAFGTMTGAQFEARLAELVSMLNHEQFAVRTGAQRLLAAMGPLAVPALRPAAASPQPELRIRARELLGAGPGEREATAPTE